MAEYKPQDAVLMSTTTTQYCLKDSTHTEAPAADTDWKDLHGIQTLSDIGTTAPTATRSSTALKASCPAGRLTASTTRSPRSARYLSTMSCRYTEQQ